MKKLVLFIFTIFLYSNIYSQLLNQDADGKSSIVWGGGVTGINFQDESLDFHFYSSTYGEKGPIIGVSLKGKNNSGISDLISKGDFTPNSELSFLLGKYNSKTHYKSSESKIKKLKEIKKSQQNYLNSHGKKIDEYFYSLIRNYFSESKETKKLEGELKKIYDSTKTDSLKIKIVNKIEKIYSDSTNVDKELLTKFLHDFTNSNKIEILVSKHERIEKLNREISQLEKKYITTTSKSKLYLRLGINTKEFKYDLGNQITDFGARFVDTTNLGYYLDLGYNVRYGSSYFGFSIGILNSDNFDDLKKSNYSYTYEDSTLQSGKLLQKEEITVYSNDYGALFKPNLQFDYLYLVSVKHPYYISISGYLRQFFSTDANLTSDKTIIGFGTYFISGDKGKFLGGIYLQTDDLFLNHYDYFGESIRFGLTAKIIFKNLSSPS